MAIGAGRGGGADCGGAGGRAATDGGGFDDGGETVARGGSVIDPEIVDVLIEARARVARSPLAELTPRERQLLGEIAEGKSNAAIAESLVLSKRAVEKHVNAIFSKLNLRDAQDVSRRVKAALLYLAEEPD